MAIVPLLVRFSGVSQMVHLFVPLFTCLDSCVHSFLRILRFVPSWSLPAVLRDLARPPFEPLAQASFYHLTLKTVFLSAIASGQRRGMLHALTIDPGHIRWEYSGVRLIPKAGFLAKNQSDSSGPVEIFLPSLSSHSSVREDKVWCPVRALKWYLHRSLPLRNSGSLHYYHRSAPSRLPSHFSRWIVEAISNWPVLRLLSLLILVPMTLVVWVPCGLCSMVRLLTRFNRRLIGRIQLFHLLLPWRCCGPRGFFRFSLT